MDDSSKMIGMWLGNFISQYIPGSGMIAPIIGMKLVVFIETTTIHWFYYMIVIVLTAGGYIGYNYIAKIKNWWHVENNDHTKLNIFLPGVVKNIIMYMNTYPEYFDKKPNIDFGDINFVYNDHEDYLDVKTFSTAQIIKFNDKNFNVYGYIQVFEVDQIVKDNTIKVKYPRVCVHNSCSISAEVYLTKIQQRNIDDAKNDDRINLRYIKYMLTSAKKMGIYGIDIYDGSKQEIINNKDMYFADFFHPKKQNILNRIARADRNECQFSALFYGPPGTGKSSLVYRIAMNTQRFIVSLDLTSINYKADIYTYFKGITSSGIFKDHQKIIILLEEFDTVFDYLKKKEKMSITMKHSWLKKDDTDSENITTLGNPEEFTLRDLLELLQGPIPMLGRMIIATTNRLDDIKNDCPALFRTGRLEPIEFGYLDYNEINKMLDYYFPEHPEIHITFNPHISTVTIMEFIKHALENNNPEYVKTAIKEHAV